MNAFETVSDSLLQTGSADNPAKCY